ncbi:survival protein sure-like phosphatase/nucleotidase [Hyaloraphidium curvatum]|nr:survival protein sure-like phosphatase/nucleotidase [Hyaloraphidium curvatum]
MPRRPPPRMVLFSNDDGPPGDESPFILPFIEEVERRLGWRFRVAIPATQKSWIGKGFVTKDHVPMTYYDRQTGTMHDRAPADGKPDRWWTCLEGTPAACVNIGLHHLWPDEIDLVLSGPNFGRNSSNAMTLNSGTVGAAIDAVLCGVRAVALSFAFYGRDFPEEWTRSAVDSAVGIVGRLWDNWPEDGKVDMFNVNIPLVPPPAPPIHVTHIHKGHYGSLYKPVPSTPGQPAAFKWAPTFHVPRREPEPGSDGHALQHRCISVSPMVANFECASADGLAEVLGASPEEGEADRVSAGEGEAVLGEKLEQPGRINKM